MPIHSACDRGSDLFKAKKLTKSIDNMHLRIITPLFKAQKLQKVAPYLPQNTVVFQECAIWTNFVP
jgi:hypothetical protein